MHILLTDIMTCPVCGPDFGLILRADRMADRRTISGALGCPHCERQYPIDDGIADLTTAAETPGHAIDTPADEAVPAGDEAADRIAALLGLGQSSGFAMILGPAAAVAGSVAARAAEYEIIADANHAPASPGVSRIRLGSSLPFYSGRLRGLWLSGADARRNLDGAARVLHPLGRLVLEPAMPDVVEAIEALDLRIIARQDQTVLAARR